MPDLGDLKKSMNGYLAIGPVEQLIELRQLDDPQVWLEQYAPQPKIVCQPFNSSDNITRNFQALPKRTLLGSSRSWLGDTARFDENHIARRYGPLPAKNIASLMSLL